MQPPEVTSLDPENYKKYFRVLYWSGPRKIEKKPRNKSKKEKLRRLKAANSLAICNAPTLLANPSQFAVYTTVRRAVLGRWRNLYSLASEYSDESENEDCNQVPMAKLPKITGIGLRTVFSLISQARFKDAAFCEQALRALLDVLQGHAPEELYQEPTEIISNLHAMLVEVASGGGPGARPDEPTLLTALSCSCLVALSVARGETDLILHAIASLIITHQALSVQSVQIPSNVITLQRSVQSYILGTPSRNLWLNYGVPNQSLVTSFPVDLPPQVTAGHGDLIVRSLVSDGCYLYVYTSKSLLKIGSGYGSSIKQHVYLYKQDFFSNDRHGWLGYCKNKLYLRIGRKKTEIYEIDKESLEVINIIKLDPGLPPPIEPKSAVFTDGNLLGLILLTNYETLTVRMFDVESATERTEGACAVKAHKELCVKLLRRRTLTLGRAPFEEGLRRSVDLDAPVAMQLDDCDDDPLISITAGQDFGLLGTASGKVYYTGKAASLGYKVASPQYGRWSLMKETILSKSEGSNAKKCKITMIAMGHEGVHAIIVLDNGTALFTGVARRGEDGDSSKHRRQPKPTRPKKMLKAEGHHIVYAACNYGSTALVTQQGLLLMFGKDTQHCDSAGVVTGLRHEKIVQVALGKAHAVALTSTGLVYTFGINNKGQCGREFGYSKEKGYSVRRPSQKDEHRICTGTHTWQSEYCRVCVLCRECTGFSSACQCASLADREPRELCGCGEGDSGCSLCGACRRCADAIAAAAAARPPDDDGDGDASSRDDSRSEEVSRYGMFAAAREGQMRVSCLQPARVAVPGGHRAAAVAAGLHHTALLMEHGEVLTFGSNQFGQLGAGDACAHHRIVRVRAPRAAAVACGSNHTALLTRDGELYTFGNYQKGALGRPRMEEPAGRERSPVWYATPGRVSRLGPRHACKAVAVTAAGDQTFVQVSQALIKTDTLFSSTITGNNNTIMILPNRPEHAFKCITINKSDGSCNAWTGPEQVDFVNSLACLDPLYDVLWCYQPQMKVMKCYNVLAYDTHKLQRCCSTDSDTRADSDYEYPNYGSMKRMEDFKNLDNMEIIRHADERQQENVALTNMSILNPELAIPCVHDAAVTRMHAALHLLGCLDSLSYAHDTKISLAECKREKASSPVLPTKEDFLTVNRFESHGGGWGYSGHSIEAIRFMCDTDILLGGFGLFGGRGDYTAKIKLFDIGPDGGEQEGDGEMLAESEDVVFECAPRDKYPVLFDAPVPVLSNRWYVAWACINGPSSDCGSSGQAMVINDEVGFHFKTSKKSNNGTDVNAGQIPCLLYNTVSPDNSAPVRCFDQGDPVIALTKNISRKVTVACFRSLIKLLQWSWTTFKQSLLDTNGQIPINYQKLTLMKHQKRLVYVIRACLRLTRSYVNEVYPQNNRKRNSHDFMSYFEPIADVRNIIQAMLADASPTCAMLPKKPGKNKNRVCYVQFALELSNSVLQECHETVTSCFHAFFPTPTLKWHHLCSILFHVKEGVVPPRYARELSATCAAMCVSRSLRDVLQYVIPVTQSAIILNSCRRDNKHKSEACKSATVPRATHKPPPVPPRAAKDSLTKILDPASMSSNYTEWHILDVLPRLLDIVMTPIKQQMMTRQCGRPHDHGEDKLLDQVSRACCKFTSRLVAELAYGVTNIRDELITSAGTVKHYTTPSRFMRVNPARAWNTGNGSPDAICFTVDRPGILLAGVGVYAGLGSYDYELELLHDVRQQRASVDEGNMSHCWVSIECIQGTFTQSDVQEDMVVLKFERLVPLKEEVRYAIRLCNHGGRTVNGDCGLPSVKGPDGTTFRFASCSLSFNGTSMARGQIPVFLYHGSSKHAAGGTEPAGSMLTTLRSITLRVSAAVLQRCAELFSTLRGELTAEDLRRNAAVLQHSPAVNTLLPYTLSSLEGCTDEKSVVQILEMIHKLLPHLAAVNQLVPGAEEAPPATTTSHYYTWVESDHPYKPATVSNMRVLFPATVSWVSLEMDLRSITAQPEDSLTIYASTGVPKQRCHCAGEGKLIRPPFRKRYVQLSTEGGDVEELCDESAEDAPCLHYNCTYVAITPKMANVPSEWPQKAILVPGNEVIFSLETASDYLNEYKKANNDDNRYGFRCLCVGYEDAPFCNQRQGLQLLEMELAYAGAACAARLLSPEIDIPPLTHATVMELHTSALNGSSPATADDDDASKDANEALMLSRGLELASPPTIHQVLEAQPLPRCMSTERQFLSDLVAGAESSAGGRLARWLAPASRVEPALCELRAPAEPARPRARLTVAVVLKDQYGEPVTSHAVKVEVLVQKLEQFGLRNRCCMPEAQRAAIPDVPYHPTGKESMRFQAITTMKAYQGYSYEELRFASGVWGGAGAGPAGALGRVPPDRLAVRTLPDGSHAAVWTPRAPGDYELRATLDEYPVPQVLSIEIAEPALDGGGSRGLLAPQPLRPARLRRFEARHSAGLRVRASPSLQAEELGTVPRGAYIAFVEEAVNKDGTWLRLSAESMQAYADSSAAVAWCLQYHRQLERVLLLPLPATTSPQSEYSGSWMGYGDEQGDMHVWTQAEDDMPQNEFVVSDDKRPQYYREIQDVNKFAMSAEDAVSPVTFGPEPSKRGRRSRDESPNHSPRRLQLRSNGNGGGDEWWTPEKHRNSDNDGDANQELADDVLQEEQRDSRLAQTGTQTSPDNTHDEATTKAGRVSPVSFARNCMERCSRALKRGASPPPPLPARAPPHPAASPAPPRPPPRASALSPAQAECLRAVFAALLWHEGIVHDAIACAAFLKFHPSLPKGGAPVVTRAPHAAPPPRAQRHSVEVSSAGETATLHFHCPPSPGIVHDAIACAAFLKLHPSLPKGGAPVVMRAPHAAPPPRAQRHSVEVSSAGETATLHFHCPPSPGIVHDAIACAAFLKLHPSLPKGGAPVVMRAPHAASPPRAQRHSVEVSSAGETATLHFHCPPPPGIVHDAIACASFLKFHPSLPKGGAPVVMRAPHAAPPPRAQRHSVEVSSAGETATLHFHCPPPPGIVHDAVACAAFLKFHPSLPKGGSPVVTRAPHAAPPPRTQWHSVEVSSAGQYLRIQPSTWETLARSGAEASASRARKLAPPISEEDHNTERTAQSVVNVLPPALRALVGLWDALNDADQLAAASDKFNKEGATERNENEGEHRSGSCLRKKRDWKAAAKTSHSAVRCELCGGGLVQAPVAAHMRHAHPGCRGATTRGYDRAGAYRRAEPPPPAHHAPPPLCGQLAQAYHLWYIFCERCRERTLRSAVPSRSTTSRVDSVIDPALEYDHHVIKENAMFLLDLAPLTNSESASLSPWQETAGRSPPSPPGSLWQPAPPFQCLSALGAERTPAPAKVDAPRYHSLGRAQAPPAACHNDFVPTDPLGGSAAQWPRVHRSISMGQAGGSTLSTAARPPRLEDVPPFDPHDTLTGGGSSLLAQPSASLQRLVGGGEWTERGCSVSAFEPSRLDPDELMKRPTLAFLLARRDLTAYRQKMDAAVRINTVRQYAFEALNWLLRSVTQPTCAHDVMWWFCSALDKFAHYVTPEPQHDNKEAGGDQSRVSPPTASASALCPGGRAARGARAAFHAFLGSVSALAPSLPPASAAALQAVRCWALHYTQHDRAFLHRSQVFSVISRILSHSEDGVYEDGALDALHDSFHSYLNKESLSWSSYVWACPDVTSWCDVTVSSRQGMAGALTDGSTETFWESGDEDRNKAKWVQVSYPGGTPADRPHIVCLHIDNTRDTVNKTLLVSFLYSGGSSEMYHMQDIEVDSKNAAWLCYALPRVTCSPLRVRCELRGPEPSVRVRQVRVLSAPAVAPARSPPPAPAQLLRALTEADTLRVFRLLTTQVFGKLLEWEQCSGSEAEADDGGAPADDSDLREHIVGILFAGHQLTSLQRQVMSHIVAAIGCEGARARDDWETALLCAEAAERAAPDDEPVRAHVPTHVQDNYCFEMLSLLLALSGSAVGRAHLAQRTELVADLLALLHTGSERVQRQVISLLRRMIAEISPQKMLAAINYGTDANTRVSLLDHLVSYLAKAIVVQVKVKGSSVPASSVTMGGRVAPAPPATWFMRGRTTQKHAHLVAKLMADMAEDKVSAAWGGETRAALAGYISRLGAAERSAARCLSAPVMWLALAALCVCQQSQLDTMNPSAESRGGEARRGEGGGETRPYCANHDDGATLAVVECRSCGALCPECDRCLHLRRAARGHHRQICKEEESAIRIDIHEGCGRAKLFWLLLLVDRRTLKALAEFRGIEPGCEGAAGGEAGPAAGGPPGLAGTCRFCGARGNTGLLAIGNVCADHQCQEHGQESCTRVLGCGHLCGGVRGERACLPCLFGCGGGGGGAGGAAPLRQDADDMCMICFTDPLQAAPAIQLRCGHVFHLHCCKKVLANKWNGPRISFSFSQCPICKEDMSHWTLEELLAPIRSLAEEVRRKALMRLEYEGQGAAGGGAGRGRAAIADPAVYAMERYAYYVCHKCGKAYFGGLARCEAESSWWEPAELVCGACSDVAGACSCPKHGADFLEYKCRYCCAVAVFFCFGTTHFCNACHDDFQRVTNIPKHQLPHCPAGPKGEQLPGSPEECPLHVEHPPTGEEFALGCGVCRPAHAF